MFRNNEMFRYEECLWKEIVMGYLNEDLIRASVESIKEYYFCGGEGAKDSEHSYEMRLKKADQKLWEITKEYDTEGEESRLYRVVSEVLAVHDQVFMEVGMLAGLEFVREPEGDEYLQYKVMYISLFQEITRVVETLQEAQRGVEEFFASDLNITD